MIVVRMLRNVVTPLGVTLRRYELHAATVKPVAKRFEFETRGGTRLTPEDAEVYVDCMEQGRAV